jgi:hypothetical protein
MNFEFKPHDALEVADFGNNDRIFSFQAREERGCSKLSKGFHLNHGLAGRITLHVLFDGREET